MYNEDFEPIYDLTFEPKSEEELVELLEEGDGSFEVTLAEKLFSKSSGLPMIKLTMKVWDCKGNQGVIYDYLMLTDSKFSLRKIRHFCYAADIPELYKSGRLNSDQCMNKYGKLKIGVQTDKTGTYPPKNVVNDYIFLEKSSDQQEVKISTEVKKDLNDDIPF